MTGIIYEIRNTLDGKVYIGSTILSLSRRWRLIRNQYPIKQSPLFAAMSQDGIENFTYQELGRANTPEDLQKLKQDWIRRTDPPLRYNRRMYGQSARKPATEISPIARFDPATVRLIRRLARTESETALAARFGVSQPTISLLLSRKNYRTVK